MALIFTTTSITPAGAASTTTRPSVTYAIKMPGEDSIGTIIVDPRFPDAEGEPLAWIADTLAERALRLGDDHVRTELLAGGLHLN